MDTIQTNISDPYAAVRLFRKRFEDAEALFDSGDIAGCILAAQRNITDTTLPPYYIIRNCILLTSAMDNWDDGNDWRLAAESTYSNVLRRAREMNDTNSLAALQDLREELDWLATQRDQYLQEHRAWMLEQEGEDDDDDETDSEADGVELDDSEDEAEMEAEGVKLGEGNALMGGTQLLPIRGHQASTVIEAPVMGLVPVGEDEEDSEGREEATAADEEGEEGGSGNMSEGGEQASTGDDDQLPNTARVDREAERSADIAAVDFLFECQSYMPEHVRVQFNQTMLTLQGLEVAMRSIVSSASAAPPSSTAASRINLVEQFKVAMVRWFQYKEKSSVMVDELVDTTLEEWQGVNSRIHAAFGREDIVSFCRELDGKDGFRYYKFGGLRYKP